MLFGYKYYNKKIAIDKKNYVNTLKKAKLLQLLWDRFPQRITIAKDKKALKEGKIGKNKQKTKENFIENEYIYYNAQTCNFLIIDIDHKNIGIFQIIDILEDNFIYKPNWIIETAKGWQVGFVLEKPFILNPNHKSKKDKKLEKWAKNMLKNLAYVLGGDFNAIRLQGFFRNPIGMDLNKYRLFVQDQKFFNLSDFDIILPFDNNIDIYPKPNQNGDFHKDKQIIKQMIEELILKGNIDILKQVKEGYRNAFFWYMGMYLIKHSPNNWGEMLNNYNKNIPKPLKEQELEQIKRSVKKYQNMGKNWVGLGSYETWTKELKNAYMKDYLKRTGKIKHTQEEIKEINKNKVLQTIYKLKSKGEKLTIVNIAKATKMNRKTVSKYVKQLKQKPQFACLFKK